MSASHSIPVSGGVMSAYVALPAALPAPVIIVIQEIFGVNAQIRSLCDAYAAQGYIALAPDMFWRIEPHVDITDQTQGEWDKAFDLYNKFDVDQGVRDLDTALAYARQIQVSSGAVGCIGFCLGGKLAYLMATRTKIDAAVSYYGVGIQDLSHEMADIKAPCLLHIAALDQFVPPDAQKIILAQTALNPLISVHVYDDCDHAFARDGGAHYNAQAAALAHERSFALLDKTLKKANKE